MEQHLADHLKSLMGHSDIEDLHEYILEMLKKGRSLTHVEREIVDLQFCTAEQGKACKLWIADWLAKHGDPDPSQKVAVPKVDEALSSSRGDQKGKSAHGKQQRRNAPLASRKEAFDRLANGSAKRMKMTGGRGGAQPQPRAISMGGRGGRGGRGWGGRGRGRGGAGRGAGRGWEEEGDVNYTGRGRGWGRGWEGRGSARGGGRGRGRGRGRGGRGRGGPGRAEVANKIASMSYKRPRTVDEALSAER